ncbi:MAG: TolC family protein [Flavobacteriaceae bacterium]|nr:TolC family protein [Formosa sp.]MDG1374667.1 TolC family protein [Flavobacteriaceae bacterium]MDG2498915.1 TolC family protein [Flavobacteriaceae bacterium]
MKHICTVLFLIGTLSGFAQKKWTLKECVDHALEHNITIKQSQNNLLINAEDVIAAKGQFLPSVSGSLGERLNIGSGFDRVTNQRIFNQTTHSFNYNININQNVFNGFRTLNLYKQSLLNQEINNLELARIKDNISLNVVNAYLNVLFNIENLEVAINQFDFSQQQLIQVRNLVNAGIQPKANLFTSEANLSRDEQQVTIAENNYNLSLLSLSQLLQIPFNGFEVEIIDLESPSDSILYNDIQPIISYAFGHRNEIIIAERNIENAELNTEISRSGYYPSVNFNYGFGSTWSESKNDFFKQEFFTELDVNKGHNFNLSVNIPIFSRFQNKTAVAKSRIQENNSQLNFEQAKLDLESNIQRAFTDAQAAFKAYNAAQKSLASQEFAFTSSNERYTLGNITAFDLEQARVQFINAQSSLINAKFDFIFKTKVLDFYMGKPLTP